MDRLIIGSRGSKLALWQTNWVKTRLEQAHPQIEIDTKIITTKGDRITNVSLPTLGAEGKGLFTKELEDEMRNGSIDIAVHSLKDLPTDLPDDLEIGAISEREDVRDALVAKEAIGSFLDLPNGAAVGTSSLRRQAQLLAARGDLKLVPVRGNVDTRIRKVETEYDAVVLASAGLRRLGYDDRITEYLPTTLVLPAVGQGALAIECRKQDPAVNEVVSALDHKRTRSACEAERAFLKGLGGGCLVPIAALGQIAGRILKLTGLVARPDGSEIVRGDIQGDVEDALQLGRRLAEELLGRGAGSILGV